MCWKPISRRVVHSSASLQLSNSYKYNFIGKSEPNRIYRKPISVERCCRNGKGFGKSVAGFHAHRHLNIMSEQVSYHRRFFSQSYLVWWFMWIAKLMQYFRQRLKAATLSSLPIVAWWRQSSHSIREQWSGWYEASWHTGWRDAAPCWRGMILFILPHLIIIDNTRPEKLLMSETFPGADSKCLTLISRSSSLCGGSSV